MLAMRENFIKLGLFFFTCSKPYSASSNVTAISLPYDHIYQIWSSYTSKHLDASETFLNGVITAQNVLVDTKIMHPQCYVKHPLLKY